jgi:hypothetical protein
MFDVLGWAKFIPMFTIMQNYEKTAFGRWERVAGVGEEITVEDAVNKFLSAEEKKRYFKLKRFVDKFQEKRKEEYLRKEVV